MNALGLLVDGFLGGFLHRLQSTAALAPEVGEEIAAIAAHWPEPDAALSAVEPDRLPACDHLDAALSLGYGGPEAGLAISIAALAPALLWTYSYPSVGAGRSLASRIAFSQIVGSRGLCRSDRLHIGLTLIAPHVAYPMHAHPAIELYLVVSGTADWQRGIENPMPKPPGSLILHGSEVPHAMTTADQPLLAIWTWRGDLVSPSTYLDIGPINPFLRA